MSSKVSPAGRHKPERHFSIATVAEQLDVSARTVRRWKAAGQLATRLLGGQIRISETDLTVFLALRRRGGTGGH